MAREPLWLFRLMMSEISNSPRNTIYRFDGVDSQEAKHSLVHRAKGVFRINYRLRDWLVSRQRYWGAPIPIVNCDQCGRQAVPEKDLPVLLPNDVDFLPTGESPLKYSKIFQNVRCPKCGGHAKRESATME